MKKYLCFLLLIFFTPLSAQIYQREAGETAEEFINRIKPAERTLIHPVIETTWNSKSGRKNIFAFWYEGLVHNKYPMTIAVGKLFVPIDDKNNYKMITIDKVFENGGTAQVASVFFIDSDKDGKYELGILYTWDYHHYMMSGTFYEAVMYDDIDYQNLPDCLFPLENIYGGAQGTNDSGEHIEAHFTTAAEIKSMLKKRGPAQKEDLNFVKEFTGTLGDQEITVHLKKQGSSFYGLAWNNRKGNPLKITGSWSEETSQHSFYLSDDQDCELIVQGLFGENGFKGTCENKKTGKQEPVILTDMHTSITDMGCDWQIW